MVDVEERRMKVGNTFPDKETVSLRIVEEINISDSSDENCDTNNISTKKLKTEKTI